MPGFVDRVSRDEEKCRHCSCASISLKGIVKVTFHDSVSNARRSEAVIGRNYRKLDLSALRGMYMAQRIQKHPKNGKAIFH